MRSSMLFGLSLLSIAIGCASAERAPCPAEAWAGDCLLRSVNKVEEREMPVPYVVYEAVYAPQPNPRYPQFMPADVRVRMGALAKYELALTDHFKAESVVQCRAAAMPGSCVPGDAVAEIKQFDPASATTNAAAAPRTTGCAAIDAASEQDRLSRAGSASTKIPERFQFAAESAALATEASTSASAVAKLMRDNPSLECVGVVGQISQGESSSLAENRARAVKQLLVSLGVESSRLTTIAINSNVYGQGSKTPDADPNLRRVSLSVLLETR